MTKAGSLLAWPCVSIWSTSSCSSRSPTRAASPRGAVRAHLALASASARIKGLEAALGAALLKRGRRGVELTAAGESLLDHARIIIHNVEAMRGDLAAYASGMRASVLLLANTSGLSEHLPKALAAFLREHRDVNVDVEERESADIAAAIANGAADLGFAAEHALPDNIERFLFSEDRLVLVAPRRGEFAGRRQLDFQEVTGHDFVGLTSFDRASGPYCKARRTARRAPEVPGAVAGFRRDLPDGGGGCRHCRGAGSRGEALRENLPISIVRIRDGWANRKLTICARSFKSLPRPAKLLVEYLREAAE